MGKGEWSEEVQGEGEGVGQGGGGVSSHHLILFTYLNPTSGNTLHTEHLASCLTGCVEEGEEGEGMVIISSSSSKMHNFKTRPEECTCLGSCQPVECGQPYYPHWLPQDPAKKLVFIQKVCGLVVHLVRG